MSEPYPLYVVDDDEAIRRSLAFLLKTSGFAVQVFEGGLPFLKAAATLARVTDGKVHFTGEIIRADGSERQHGATHATLSDAPDAVAGLAAELLARASPALRAQFGG